MTTAKDALDDFRSHAHAWRKAMRIAEEHAEVSGPDVDDKSYWRYELGAFERVAAVFAPAAPAAGDSPRETFEALMNSAAAKFAIAEEIGVGHKLRYHLNTVTAAEQSLEALTCFHYQVCNGGLQQYVSNGYATESGPNGRASHGTIRLMAAAFDDIDSALSALVIDMCKAVAGNLNVDGKSEDEVGHIETNVFGPLEARYFAMGQERAYRFFLAVAEGLDPASLPFAHGVRRLEGPSPLPGR